MLADLPTRTAPPAPRTTCAVVRLGGGTGLNSIPQEAWLDLDLRSEDPKALAQLDVTVRAALDRALDDENRRRASGTPPLTLEHRPIGGELAQVVGFLAVRRLEDDLRRLLGRLIGCGATDQQRDCQRGNQQLTHAKPPIKVGREGGNPAGPPAGRDAN